MITGVSHDDRNIAGKRTEKLGAVYNQSNFKATTTSTQLTTAWQTQDPTEQICSESSRSKQMCRKFSDSVSEKIQATDLFTPLFHLSVLWAEVSNPSTTNTRTTNVSHNERNVAAKQILKQPQPLCLHHSLRL